MERVCIGNVETVSVSRNEFREICKKAITNGDVSKIAEKSGASPVFMVGTMLANTVVTKEIEKELFGSFCNCEHCRGGGQ